MAAIDYMEGGKSRPWWSFTGERKRRYGPVLSKQDEQDERR